MLTTTAQFVKKQRSQLPIKYARYSLRNLVYHRPKTTIQNLKDISQAYSQFIETPHS